MFFQKQNAILKANKIMGDFMSKRILFQGDSITDCSRGNDYFFKIGTGYANAVAAELGAKKPCEYEFINRGISGNRIVDLYARLKVDFINLKPDVASIYIGVNDTWHEIASQNGVDTKKFEKLYDMMLEEIFLALPDIKLILIAPFVLEGTATCNTEEIPDRLQRFKTDVAEKAAAVKRVAQKYNLPVIELQSAFDEACKKAGPDYWTIDGVHPTLAGHNIIKNLWIEEFNKIVK